MSDRRYKIVYCTPSLYMAGGVERVLTLKANYFADNYGYDVTIITTDGEDKKCFFPLSEKVKVINLGIHFEDMWHRSFLKRLFMYLPKERQFKKLLTIELNRIKPDITISVLRREINFLTEIHDGSKKIGEIHINRAHYRNFTPNRTNPFKALFAKYWMHGLVKKLKQLDRFVVLTEYDRQAWQEIPRVDVIPNPLPFYPDLTQVTRRKRIISIGRYFSYLALHFPLTLLNTFTSVSSLVYKTLHIKSRNAPFPSLEASRYLKSLPRSLHAVRLNFSKSFLVIATSISSSQGIISPYL